MLKKILAVMVAAATIISGISVPVMAAEKNQNKKFAVLKRPEITVTKSTQGLTDDFRRVYSELYKGMLGNILSSCNEKYRL